MGENLLKRTVPGIVIIILFTTIFTSTLDIQPAKAAGKIYIRADGTIDPHQHRYYERETSTLLPMISLMK